MIGAKAGLRQTTQDAVMSQQSAATSLFFSRYSEAGPTGHVSCGQCKATLVLRGIRRYFI